VPDVDCDKPSAPISRSRRLFAPSYEFVVAQTEVKGARNVQARQQTATRQHTTPNTNRKRGRGRRRRKVADRNRERDSPTRHDSHDHKRAGLCCSTEDADDSRSRSGSGEAAVLVGKIGSVLPEPRGAAGFDILAHKFVSPPGIHCTVLVALPDSILLSFSL
jgi:hypothetical protein